MALLQRKDRKLTSEEKHFAKRFRDAAQAQLTALVQSEDPTYKPPMFLAIFRHKCSVRPHQESTAIELKEVYVSSVDPIVYPGAGDGSSGDLPLWAGHATEYGLFQEIYPDAENFFGQKEGLPLFGFIYKTGECRKCKETAISPAGMLVLQSERPPVSGRMARD